MDISPPTEELNNFIGAVLFVGYVLAALFLTVFLTYNLTTTYCSLDPVYKSVIAKRTNVLTTLSCLSFSALSYNMLSYLIVSYTEWARVRNIALPSSMYDFFNPNNLVSHSNEQPKLRIWQWLASSTLFKDFAQTICASEGAFFWTAQALAATMAWSVFMSTEGQRLKIPYLWAYALIGQILPVSFAMNLFFIAMLVYCPTNSSSGWLFDLRASDHIVSEESAFTHIETFPEQRMIEMTGQVSNTGGIVSLPCITTQGMVPFVLQDVIYAPHFNYKLISARRLCQASSTWIPKLNGAIEIRSDGHVFTASIHTSGQYFIDTSPASSDETAKMPFRSCMMAGMAAFAFFLHLARLWSGGSSTSFLLVILMLRSLLFLPLLLSWFESPAIFSGTQCWPSYAQRVAHQSYILLFLFLATVLKAGAFPDIGKMGSTKTGILEAVNDDPSISALGYDYIVILISAFIWRMEDFTVRSVATTLLRIGLQAPLALRDCILGL